MTTTTAPNAAQDLLDKLTGNIPTQKSLKSTRDAAKKFIRKKGETSSESQFANNLLALVEEKGADLDLAVRNFDAKFDEIEIRAVLAQAATADYFELVVHWAVCGPSDLAKQALALTKASNPGRIMIATSVIVQTLVGSTPIASPDSRRWKKVIGTLLSESARTCNPTHIPFEAVIETAAVLAKADSSELLDLYISKIFSKTNLKNAGYMPVAPHGEGISSLLAGLRTHKIKTGGARQPLLVLAAQCDHSRLEPSIWDNISLDQLIGIKKFPGVRKLLADESMRPIVVQRLTEGFETLPIWAALDKFSEFGDIQPDLFLPILVRRSSGNSYEAKLLRSVAQAVADDESKKALAEKELALEGNATREIQKAKETAEEALQEKALSEKRLQETITQLEQLKRQDRSLRDYERSRARFDALKSFVGIVERVRGWSTHDLISPETLRDVVHFADLELAKFGIQILGKPGETLEEFHQLFELPDTGQAGPFVVISPAYLLESDVSLPVRKGLARRP